MAIHKAEFLDSNDQIVEDGDKVFYALDKSVGKVSDILQDGDAYITYPDGTGKTVKWIYLYKWVS